MCLLIDTVKHKRRKIKFPWQLRYKPKIADRDILCSKTMIRKYGDDYIFSPIVSKSPWKFNKIYKTRMMHDYDEFMFIGQGFHACLSKKYNTKVIIPKGAKYFVSNNFFINEIVSNKMKIVK